jgi:hypothetical protein
MRKFVVIVVMYFVLMSAPAAGYEHPQFNILVPYGNIINCAMCHTNGLFRLDLLEKYYIWGPELAVLDSDGDGFTNGTELQDPYGNWSPFDPNPGDSALISNPDDSLSTPETGYGIEDEIPGLNPPRAFFLAQNYPNPVTFGTSIDYAIPRSERVVMTIYDVSGRVVRQLVNADRKVGKYSVHWDGRNASGRRVSGGMYLVRIKAGNFTATRKLMFMK